MEVPGNWYESFFSGVAVDMWMQAMPRAVTEQEADRIVRFLEAKPNASLLDVPCGGGRLACVLRERGFRVTGVDLSEESLAYARRADGAVNWEHRDMRDLPWRESFDGAYCFGNSFGYLDDDGNEQFLRSVAASLKRGGRFVLETPMAAESALLTVKERSWWKVGDVHLLVVNRFDPPSGRMETEYTYVSNGRVEVRYGTHRMYTYRQLVELFQAAGFSDVRAGTWDLARPPGAVDGDAGRLDPYRPGAPLLVLVGRVP